MEMFLRSKIFSLKQVEKGQGWLEECPRLLCSRFWSTGTFVGMVSWELPVSSDRVSAACEQHQMLAQL